VVPNTADIGIAIRFPMEEEEIEILDWESGDPIHNPPHGMILIDHIDVTDPHNPILHVGGGVFRVSIIREG
jgi:hypothetical protein